VNPNPFPGLTLSPVHGCVPAGGVTLLSATLTADAVIKFDTRVNIAVRNGKPIELRVSGTIEPPLLDIDLVCIAPLYHCRHSARDSQRRCGFKKWGTGSCNISTGSCNFSPEEIIAAQNFNFAPKFSQNGRFLDSNFVFLEKKTFRQEEIFF